MTEIDRWRSQGKDVAIATVVKVWGSAPRLPGARMVVSSADEVAGSVSGGCVENAVIQEAGEVLASGEPRLLRYSVSDEKAWSVGLSCGGTLEVFVESLADPLRDELHVQLRRSLEAERLVALATVVRGETAGCQLLLWPDGRRLGALRSEALERSAAETAARLFGSFGSERTEIETQAGKVDLFVETFPSRPRLVVIGAVHVAIALVRLARSLGFRTLVIDPRSAFATRERFPDADEVIAGWPQEVLQDKLLHESTYVAALSHDLKIDVPALAMALRGPARYVGALGSRKTHAKRVEKLRDAGATEEQIARIHAPIGLDLGGRSPGEIALSIMAQIVAVSHGREDSQPGARR
jgi:xanthine dehydrogenase accessory factor